MTDERLAELTIAAKALAHRDASNGALMLEMLEEITRARTPQPETRS